MNEVTARNSINKKVLASDPYWGSYTGFLVGLFRTPTGIRAKVLINECVEYPSQWAILFKDNRVIRNPDKSGSISNFDLKNVILYEWDDNGGIGLEEIIKNTVSVVLEAKLGYKVEVSHKEWEEAKREALNDAYNNKFCFFANVSADDFINTMVLILAIVKRSAA